jgi:hypothetical protein
MPQVSRKTWTKFRREAKRCSDHAKNLRRIANRNKRFALSLTNAALCLEDCAKYLGFVCEEIAEVLKG